MTRKYKQAAKRRNKTAVQKYRTSLGWSGCDDWKEWPLIDYVAPPLPYKGPGLWQRITAWFKR